MKVNTNNEKAPDGLPSDQSAKELVQPQNTSDYGNCQEPVDLVIPALVKLAGHGREIQIYDGLFFDLFSFGSYDIDRDDGFDRYSANVEGVQFFCLVEKNRLS